VRTEGRAFRIVAGDLFTGLMFLGVVLAAIVLVPGELEARRAPAAVAT
jgi:hypothetical protein